MICRFCSWPIEYNGARKAWMSFEEGNPAAECPWNPTMTKSHLPEKP